MPAAKAAATEAPPSAHPPGGGACLLSAALNGRGGRCHIPRVPTFRALLAFPICGVISALAAEAPPDTGALRAAVAKSLPLLQQSARTSMEKRKQCFTCHNQALPVLAMTTARRRGIAIDDGTLREQLAFTAEFLARNRENYLAGKGQGGQALTAGYALLALEKGGWKPDDTTAAVADYLLQWQRKQGYWKPQSIRPPSEASLFTTSFVSVRALHAFGSAAQQERIRQRVAQVREWALRTAAEDTEDRVFRLRLLREVAADAGEIRRATEELIKLQRDDGGWAQLPTAESDAYATGTALVALHEAGGIATDTPSYRRGLRWLLDRQEADGSWHVTTRSRPIQTYYEAGYPHGADQFISITAAGWSTTALALALPSAVR
jgi:hypothetical protein